MYPRRLSEAEHHSPRYLYVKEVIGIRMSGGRGGGKNSTCTNTLNSNRLRPVSSRGKGLLRRIESGVEERVNQRRLSQARLP